MEERSRGQVGVRMVLDQVGGGVILRSDGCRNGPGIKWVEERSWDQADVGVVQGSSGWRSGLGIRRM